MIERVPKVEIWEPFAATRRGPTTEESWLLEQGKTEISAPLSIKKSIFVVSSYTEMEPMSVSVLREIVPDAGLNGVRLWRFPRPVEVGVA